MKPFVFAVIALFSLASAKAQPTEASLQGVGLPVVELLEIRTIVHDFGTIPQNKPVYYYFEIVNRGELPLKLDNVQASCGCTTPEWSKDPIAAGASARIKVGFNAASDGPFDKFITITYNGSQTKQVRIKGMVWKAPTGSAPANAAVQFLKQQIQ